MSSASPFYHLVPKDLQANLDFREDLIEYGNTGKAAQSAIWEMCARDILFYINTFCWIFEPRAAKELPFITWEFQDEFLLEMQECMGIEDVVIVKSRDMGVSWCVIASMEYPWHFSPLGSPQTFTMLSRKEDLVDKTGEPDSLFWKLDFLHKHQPGWLLPTTARRKLIKENNDNGSTVSGESTNEFAGVAGRKRAMMLDEFSKMDNQGTIFTGTQHTTDCRIFVYTPQGAANKAYEIAEGADAHNRKQIRLHWARHPDKRPGLYRVTDGTVEVLDPEWHKKNPGYSFVKSGEYFKNGQLRSPWYDKQCLRANHPAQIAQELDMNFLSSDFQFFNAELLDLAIKTWCCEPFLIGNLDYVMGTIQPTRFEPNQDGFLKLWFNVPANGKPPEGEYTIGCDISAGTGATPTVFTIADNKTNEQVGEWATNHTDPSIAADVAVALSRWFYDALLGWEAPGPGRSFGSRILDLRYGNIYYRRDESIQTGKISQVPGWWPTPDNKWAIMGEYKRATMDGTFVVRSKPQIEECKRFIYTTQNRVRHSSEMQTDDPSASGHAHGDRPTSGAICWHIMRQGNTIESDDPVEVPVGCLQWRMDEKRRVTAGADEW